MTQIIGIIGDETNATLILSNGDKESLTSAEYGELLKALHLRGAADVSPNVVKLKERHRLLGRSKYWVARIAESGEVEILGFVTRGKISTVRAWRIETGESAGWSDRKIGHFSEFRTLLEGALSLNPPFQPDVDKAHKRLGLPATFLAAVRRQVAVARALGMWPEKG